MRIAVQPVDEARAVGGAEAEGIERDIVTQATLFAALTDLVSTWGEVAVADFTEKLTERVLEGGSTLDRRLQ